MSLSLVELFPQDRVLRLRAPDQGAVIAALAKRAAASLGVPAAEIAAALAAREALGSTGIGAGIAVPHARLAHAPAVSAWFTRLERPVDWRAVDGREVDLVFLLLSPENAASEHLAALAMATRRLRDASVAAALRAANDAEALRRALIGEVIPTLIDRDSRAQ